MVERILSISGKPGLFRLVNQAKGSIIVENVETKRRMPAYSRDKVVSLADVAIYADDREVPLYDVFDEIKTKYDGKPVDIKGKSTEELREMFAEILPDFDRERVYNNDIKKVFAWYNTLIANGVTQFKDDEIKEDQAAEAAEAADEAQTVKE